MLRWFIPIAIAGVFVLPHSAFSEEVNQTFDQSVSEQSNQITNVKTTTKVNNFETIDVSDNAALPLSLPSTLINTPRTVALNWSAAEMLLSLGIKPVGLTSINGYRKWQSNHPALPEGVAEVGNRSYYWLSIPPCPFIR